MPTSKTVATNITVKDAQPTVKVMVELESTDCGILTPSNEINLRGLGEM